MKQQKRKKRSKATKSDGVGKGAGDKKDERKVLETLLEASISVQAEANEDLNKDAEIVGNLAESAEERSTTSSCWNVGSSSCTSTSEVSVEDQCFQDGVRQKSKMKKVVASAGTVSSLLGKDYMMSVPKKSSSRLKGCSNGEFFSKEDAEQFLCSMLGDECQLSLAVVSDVFCQCGYDIHKALNILLELSASSNEQPKDNRVDAPLHTELNDNFTDKAYDSSSLSSESDFPDSIWNTGNSYRNRLKFNAGIDEHSSPTPKISESQLTEDVLKSLFNMPTPKSAEHEPNTMNWRNVVTKMASFRPKPESSPGKSVADLYDPAKGDDYEVFRQASKSHWESMKFYYQKATSAFTNGERGYAAYLSEQGSSQIRKAQEADKKASLDIFDARNKSIENVITIDLHGQHVKQAMEFLKLHLLFGAYVRSVRSFKVITGCGSHGVGKSKLKTSVINLLDKEGIEWREENRGALLIKLHGQTNFSFVDSDSDSDD
ncbi:PREDICTED: SMR domain-containing protein At5g58720 isoform X1 [Ipomoea nil]|uniref:SMR domain-containing protein At5g58720 isoform X1 n=1 Tax=Ipomoea nil TaxID=35883 RepID=UPI000900AC95|nr:PREDICTED: SMR domain-containing protein At5g58720 isoform X1 [Ipomoea nil]XP_019167700.1 PREDICTED: SMR domain-containing protein At5g58720 isoform X1 [Ipomoea nil]